MTGGKSTFLENKYRQYSKTPNMRILVVSHNWDSRASPGKLQTHAGLRIPAISMSSLCTINVDEYDVILIDEAQWFTDLPEFIERNYGKNVRVYVAGLISDFKQRKFGAIADILHLVSDIKWFSAVCDVCGSDAGLTKRRGSDETRDIPGGTDKYYTVCAKHLCCNLK